MAASRASLASSSGPFTAQISLDGSKSSSDRQNYQQFLTKVEEARESASAAVADAENAYAALRMLIPSGADGVHWPARRPLIRNCIDWSEQRHHLAGALGRRLVDRLTELGWIRRAPATRAAHITDIGHHGLRDTFGVKLNDRSPPFA